MSNHEHIKQLLETYLESSVGSLQAELEKCEKLRLCLHAQVRELMEKVAEKERQLREKNEEISTLKRQGQKINFSSLFESIMKSKNLSVLLCNNEKFQIHAILTDSEPEYFLTRKMRTEFIGNVDVEKITNRKKVYSENVPASTLLDAFQQGKLLKE